jgi:hypothetical protein
MSALQAHNSDDFPDAATKHLGDARALHAARRHDGACYLLGYVVECSLKAVYLHDRAWESSTRTHNKALLLAAHHQVSHKPLGHDLSALLAVSVGPEGARYLPDLPPPGPGAATILTWKETLRYRSPAPDADIRAASWSAWAEFVHDHTVIQMQLDGVL